MSEELLRQRSARQIPVDAYRRLTDLKIHLDLPGVDPGSIELTVERDVLSVVATRNWIPSADDVVELQERAQGEFRRQLMLGESLDREHITATYEDGVLTITIPVSEQAKPRKVEITHAASVAQPIEAVSTSA
ncbi:MAG: Hsp20/alpha crystallin family protein [Acidimicrobiales bacterium]